MASWRHATNLVALDLEGSGAQDGADEAILEIAAVRLIDGHPDATTAYTSRIDSGRAIPARPWISPGLAGRPPAGTPTMDTVGTELAHRLAGAYLIGHNVTVDWRLLHRRCPQITIAGLIDTYRLARAVRRSGRHALAALLAEHQLTDKVSAGAPYSRPHRALWDTIGTALLLDALIHQHWTTEPSLSDLLTVACPPTASRPMVEHHEEPATLFSTDECD